MPPADRSPALPSFSSSRKEVMSSTCAWCLCFFRICCLEPRTFVLQHIHTHVHTQTHTQCCAPCCPASRRPLPFSLRLASQCVHCSILFDLFLLEAVWLELVFDVTVRVFCLPGSSYLPKKKIKMICWISFL